MLHLTPSLTRSTLATLIRGAIPVIAAVGALGLLGSCTGERPSLGPAVVTASTGSTSTPASSSTSAPTGKTTLGPDSLLGYIATPTGKPVVHVEPKDDSLTLDLPAKTGAGAPTTFAVVGNPTGDGDGWIQVLLPTRPNGTTAWVPVASVAITKTDLQIFVDLSARLLTVKKASSEVLASKIAIGDTVNPTPVGATYLTELIDNNEPAGPYGPYAFGLALHSDTLSEFGGGDGQVGIHGTNQPKLIGQAVSHGCVRLTNGDVKKLVGLSLPLGAPVFIS